MLAPLFFVFFVFFFHFIRETSHISVLFLFPGFFPCKTRSSTHLLTTPSRFPISTTTCRVRPWLVLKVSVISTSDLYYYDGFFRSHFSIFFLHCCVGGCVAIKSLLPLVFSDKKKKAVLLLLLILMSTSNGCACAHFHVGDKCWHVFLRLLASVRSEIVERMN